MGRVTRRGGGDQSADPIEAAELGGGGVGALFLPFGLSVLAKLQLSLNTQDPLGQPTTASTSFLLSSDLLEITDKIKSCGCRKLKSQRIDGLLSVTPLDRKSVV